MPAIPCNGVYFVSVFITCCAFFFCLSLPLPPSSLFVFFVDFFTFCLQHIPKCSDRTVTVYHFSWNLNMHEWFFFTSLMFIRLILALATPFSFGVLFIPHFQYGPTYGVCVRLLKCTLLTHIHVNVLCFGLSAIYIAGIHYTLYEPTYIHVFSCVANIWFSTVYSYE